VYSLDLNYLAQNLRGYVSSGITVQYHYKREETYIEYLLKYPECLVNIFQIKYLFADNILFVTAHCNN